VEYLIKMLNTEIICGPEENFKPVRNYTGTVLVQSSDNSQTLYIDGAGDSGWPIYLGITKSRGTIDNKLPIEPNDIIGGLQVYARQKEGCSVGYSHDETPLSGSIIFKAGDTIDSSELLIAVKNDGKLSVKLVIDSKGNLKVSGSISLGALTITDESVTVIDKTIIKFVKVIHQGVEYAMPMYSIR
jgi:hypothetical protein